MIKVKAKETVYVNHKRQYAGDIFFINDEKQFSERSMERIDGKAAPKKAAKKEEKPQEKQESVI